MRKITDTRTGKIVSDTELGIEYLYVGDYGKENNIKASFLGYNKRIEKVEHRPVDITDKLVVTVSTQKGCPMSCNFCDCPKLGFHGNVNTWELISEISTAVSLSGITHGKRLNVHYARMGEPTFNPDVITATKIIGEYANTVFDEYHPVVSTMMPKNNKNLIPFLSEWTNLMKVATWNGGLGLQFSINTLDEEDRNKMFRNKSLSLAEIGKIIDDLPMPIGRKYTLNFAATSKSNLDVALMNKFFDKKKCIVKITPIHETVEATDNGYEIVTDFDVYEKFEQPLVNDGWDVIVFIPSKEEDEDRITCGNSLIALNHIKNNSMRSDIVDEYVDKTDLSQNCDFDDDSDKNDCWHCIHFLFPIGCMCGEDTDSSHKFKKREKPLYSLSKIAEMNKVKYKTKENEYDD